MRLLRLLLLLRLLRLLLLLLRASRRDGGGGGGILLHQEGDRTLEGCEMGLERRVEVRSFQKRLGVERACSPRRERLGHGGTFA
jgi:hypothetical protein